MPRPRGVCARSSGARRRRTSATHRAAAALKLTSRDLLRQGIIDEVVPEPIGGAHRDHREAAANLKAFLIRSLREINDLPRPGLIDRRYEKFRRIGVYEETLVASELPAADAI